MPNSDKFCQILLNTTLLLNGRTIQVGGVQDTFPEAAADALILLPSLDLLLRCLPEGDPQLHIFSLFLNSFLGRSSTKEPS